MIEYLYTGRIDNFSKVVALEVLGLSDMYGIENLRFLCENTLMHSVDNELVCDYLLAAHRYQALSLKKFCMDFLLKNFQDIKDTKGFESLEQCPSLLMEIMKALAGKGTNF
jgi:hypothetical protein